MDIVTLMQEIYNSSSAARAVLLKIGYPKGAIPTFETADTFWPQVLPTLDDKVMDGTLKLLKATVEANPGSRAAAELLESLTEASIEFELEIETPIEIEPERVSRRAPWARREAPDDTPPPLPPPIMDNATIPFVTEECPTLTLEGADLPDQFQAVAAEIFGSHNVTLLYFTRAQSALLIPDPGDQDEAVRQKVQERMRTYVSTCRVTYRKFSFQPYVYTKLVVYGPDTSGYELEHVPATLTPEDIAAAVVAVTREAQMSTKGGLVRAVVDHESAETSKRLDPYTTLHECGVRDGDQLRVAPDAIAGSLAPELRMAALLPAVAQIRGYAARHPEFTIVGYDDQDLPARITVEITRIGLAPPADVICFRTQGDTGSLDDLSPVAVASHRISLHFGSMFPLVAPLVVWETPVFHPNIRDSYQGGLPAGALQFHPLLLDYRPQLDLAHIARVMTEVAMYRDYDLTDGAASPDPVAAAWAGTEAGQTMIKAIGGRPLADVVHKGGRQGRPERLLWIKPLDEVRHGH